jgi:hypothetical protein
LYLLNQERISARELNVSENAILKQKKEIENNRILIGMQESEYQNQQKTILDNSVKKKELEKKIESLDETDI